MKNINEGLSHPGPNCDFIANQASHLTKQCDINIKDGNILVFNATLLLLVQVILRCLKKYFLILFKKILYILDIPET